MAKKPEPKKGKSQRERFIETARALGVDETGAEFERALNAIVPPKRPPDSGAPMESSEGKPQSGQNRDD